MKYHILLRPYSVWGRKTFFSLQIIINASRKARSAHIKAKIKTGMLQVTVLRS